MQRWAHTVQGVAEDSEECIMSLHTEMCESGDVTSVEEEHDSGNMTSSAVSKKQAAPRGTSTANEQQKLCEKTLKHQAEVDVESHVDKEKAAEIKNQVQHSNIEQPIHWRRWPKHN